MTSIKTNFIFNALLTICGYIFPLMVFPYVSRTLGVANMGACNFVDSIVDYFTILSMMGINTLGIREIAKAKNNPNDLNIVFNELFSLNTITTCIAVIILFMAVLFVPKFQDYRNLFYIGIFKLFFNYMLLNWFFQGLEDFKYITFRYIIVKMIFVISIFICIHTYEDTTLYYLLVCLSWGLNGIINIIYSRRFIRFHFTLKIRKQYIFSFFALGCYWFMNSLYTTFNVAYLGFKTNDTEVGYYTSANKLLAIIMALFTTLSSVIIPRVSALIKDNPKSNQCYELLSKSFNAVILFAIPLVIFVYCYSPKIIRIIFGTDFDGATVPLQIMSLLFLFMGINQILVLQILMPLNKDRDILFNSGKAGIIGLISTLILVTLYGKNGASIELLIGETVLFISSIHSVKKYTDIKFPLNSIIKHIFIQIPIIILYISINKYIGNYIVQLFIAGLCTLAYVVINEYYIFRNELIVKIINKIK